MNKFIHEKLVNNWMIKWLMNEWMNEWMNATINEWKMNELMQKLIN